MFQIWTLTTKLSSSVGQQKGLNVFDWQIGLTICIDYLPLITAEQLRTIAYYKLYTVAYTSFTKLH